VGNRAVIILESMPSVGVYVHWNGGPESVLAFLEATRRRGSRSPAGDATYAFARLVQTIADYFERGDGEGRGLLSVGAGPVELLDTDNGDNGTYVIGDDWEISRREHARSHAKGVPKGEEAKHQGIIEHLMRIDAAREAAAKIEG